MKNKKNSENHPVMKNTIYRMINVASLISLSPQVLKLRNLVIVII